MLVGQCYYSMSVCNTSATKMKSTAGAYVMTYKENSGTQSLWHIIPGKRQT